MVSPGTKGTRWRGSSRGRLALRNNPPNPCSWRFEHRGPPGQLAWVATRIGESRRGWGAIYSRQGEVWNTSLYILLSAKSRNCAAVIKLDSSRVSITAPQYYLYSTHPCVWSCGQPTPFYSWRSRSMCQAPTLSSAFDYKGCAPPTEPWWSRGCTCVLTRLRQRTGTARGWLDLPSWQPHAKLLFSHTLGGWLFVCWRLENSSTQTRLCSPMYCKKTRQSCK